MEDFLINQKKFYDGERIDEMIQIDEEETLPDEVYDALVDRHLKESSNNIDPNDVREKGDIRLDFPMPSLKKIKGDNSVIELNKFIQENPGEYLIQDKFDGTSIQIIFDNGTVNVFTGGNGTFGFNKNFLIPYLNLPEIDGYLVVRGELIFQKDLYDEFVKPILISRKKKGHNSRSAANGVVVSKKADEEILPYISFMAFNVMSENWNIEEQLTALSDFGFYISDNHIYDEIDIPLLEDYLNWRREESQFNIDGIVISSIPNSNEAPSEENPRHTIAFKKDILVEAIVRLIEWKPSSRYGRLNPTVHIEPVFIRDEVTKATGHNAKIMEYLQIAPGSRILITQSGEIIPYVVDCLESTGPTPFPDEDYYWDENGTYIYLSNPDESFEVKQARLAYFINKLEIEHCGPAFIQGILELGIVEISQLIRITKEQILQLDRKADKSAEKILNQIKTKITTCTMEQLMAASGIFPERIGVKIMKKFIDSFPGWKIISPTYDEILRADDFGPIRAEDISQNIDTFKQWLADHPECQPRKKEIKRGDLEGTIFCLSGSRDKSIVKQLEDRGAAYSSGWNNTVNLLLVDSLNDKTGKVKSALKKISKTPDSCIIAPISNLPNIVDKTSKFL